MTNGSAGVWVFSERQDVTLELLSVGRELADRSGSILTSVLIGARVAAQGDECLARGADGSLIVEDSRLETLRAEVCADVLCQALERHSPEILLIGATAHGTEVAARVAQRLALGCASDCMNLDFDNGEWVIERRCLGRFVAKQVIKTRPAIATIPPRRFEAPPRVTRSGGSHQRLTVEVPEARTHVIETQPRERSQVQLDKAEVIISAGRGLKSKDDLSLVKDLARVLGGTVGATRPLTDDLQWLTVDAKVGLSGLTVKPKLYIACGISGQIEHVVGMKDSGVVVAINTDPNAPIMEEADYSVVGDLYEVVPALIRALAEIQE